MYPLSALWLFIHIPFHAKKHEDNIHLHAGLTYSSYRIGDKSREMDSFALIKRVRFS